MSFTIKKYAAEDLMILDVAVPPSLDIPGIVVDYVLTPKDHEFYFIFYAHPHESVVPGECPNCKTDQYWKKAGNGAPRHVHDVSRNGNRVDIVLLPKRFECTQCGLKVTPPIPGIEEGVQATTRLMEYLRRECLLQSSTVLAHQSGFSIDTVQNIMNEEIDRLDAERIKNPLPAPRVLGIDEKHINRVMRGTLVNVTTGRLLNMLEDNKAGTMQEAIKQLKGWDTDIEVVTVDMSNAYISWLTKLLPNAKIVIDKFHVIQDIQKRISKVQSKLYKHRKEIIKNLTDPEEIVRQRDILEKVRKNNKLFHYSTETIIRDEEKELPIILATVIEAFPEFRLLRELYTGIEEVYRQETPEDAHKAWDRWVKLLPPNGEKKYKEWCDLYSVPLPLFDEFRTFNRPGFQRFKPYILNYFEPGCRCTNAATEGVNTLIERINREGNGLKFKALRGKSLYASLIHETVSYNIELKTFRGWKPTTNFALCTTFETAPRQTCILSKYIYPYRIPDTNIFTDNEALFDIFLEELDPTGETYKPSCNMEEETLPELVKWIENIKKDDNDPCYNNIKLQ